MSTLRRMPAAPQMSWPDKKHPWTAETLERLWRPSADFIGPVGPPMLLWLKDRQAQRQWRSEVNLAPADEGEA